MQRDKEAVAELMRKKQEAGESTLFRSPFHPIQGMSVSNSYILDTLANAKKAVTGGDAGGKKK